MAWIFKAEMHANPFSAGAPPPSPLGGAYHALPDPLVGWTGGHPLISIPLPILDLRFCFVPLSKLGFIIYFTTRRLRRSLLSLIFFGQFPHYSKHNATTVQPPFLVSMSQYTSA